MNRSWLAPEMRAQLPADGLLEWAETATGRVFRQFAERSTLEIGIGPNRYFLKRHTGVGWREILKNWLLAKPAVTGAGNEFEACQRLASCDILAPKAVAYAERGRNPAQRRSFVLCEALAGYQSLETLVAEWPSAGADPLLRRRLLVAVASLLRQLHAAGVVHRDLYLCHLLVERAGYEQGRIRLAVLDLHRALLKPDPARRWRRRDLAALWSSAMALPLGRMSRLRFVRVYTGRPLREVWPREGRFWQQVERRAQALWRKANRWTQQQVEVTTDAGVRQTAPAGPHAPGRVLERSPEPALGEAEVDALATADGELQGTPVSVTDLASQGRRLTAPFVFCCAGTPYQILRVYRVQPGRRVTLLGQRDGACCVIKVFLGRGARRRWKRAVGGVASLVRGGIAAPRLLAAGRSSLEGHWLRWAYIADAAPLAASDVAATRQAVALLGRMHGAGMIHSDPHLGNFLKASGRVHVIDAEKGVWRAGQRACLANLASFLAQYPTELDDRAAEFWRDYRAARYSGAGVGADAGAQRLVRLTVTARRLRLKRHLRKTQRNCTEFAVLRQDHRRCVIRRRWVSEPDLGLLLQDPEAALADAEIISAGNSATVFRLRVADKLLIVKRYNCKNRAHRLRRIASRRWRTAWRYGHALRLLAIPTAEPLALVEEARGPVPGRCYLIMACLGDRDLLSETRTHGWRPGRLEELFRLFQALAAAGLRHGDLKASNLLVHEDRVHLIDLDSMRCRSGWQEDVKRFLRNFEGDLRAEAEAVLGGLLEGSSPPPSSVRRFQ